MFHKKKSPKAPVKKVKEKISPFLRSLREHLEALKKFLKELNGVEEKREPEGYRNLGKIGFVLSGGFFHGSFQMGAIECVTEKFGIVPHYIVASSVGSINGAAIAAGQVKSATENWRTLKKEEVYLFNLRRLVQKGVIGADGLLDHRPILGLLKKHGGGEAILASPIQFDVVVTDLQKMEGAVFSNRTERDPRVMELAILASTAVPVLFSPVLIRERQYVDGGLIENTPLRYAIDAGCDTIFVFKVGRTPFGAKIDVPQVHGLFPIWTRVFAIVSRIQMEADLHRAKQTNEDVKLFGDLVRVLREKEGEIPQHVKDEISLLLSRFSFANKHAVRLIVIAPDIPLQYISPPIRGELDLELFNSMIDHGALVAEKVLREEKIV